MKFKFMLIYSFLLLFLVSCGADRNQEGQGNFYNLKGFVNEQINLLTELKPVVTKKMIVGDSVETTQTTGIDWEKELELFAQADLNKPVNNLIYSIEKDSLGVTYTLKEGEDAPVRFLKILLDKHSGNPMSVEVKLNTQNQLYESQKNLSLTCGEIKGKWRILSYQVRGFQDLVLSERKSFEIDAVVHQ